MSNRPAKTVSGRRGCQSTRSGRESSALACRLRPHTQQTSSETQRVRTSASRLSEIAVAGEESAKQLSATKVRATRIAPADINVIGLNRPLQSVQTENPTGPNRPDRAQQSAVFANRTFGARRA